MHKTVNYFCSFSPFEGKIIFRKFFRFLKFSEFWCLDIWRCSCTFTPKICSWIIYMIFEFCAMFIFTESFANFDFVYNPQILERTVSSSSLHNLQRIYRNGSTMPPDLRIVSSSTMMPDGRAIQTHTWHPWTIWTTLPLPIPFLIMKSNFSICFISTHDGHFFL